uniref:Potassium-transporting ATPase subunit KdpA n=1 Tax=Agrobacterium albertimagni TaxID=147266 RepID=A0A7C1T7R6_9HYPH
MVLILALTKPLGVYMARVFHGERTALSSILSPLERAIYRLCGIDAAEEQRWTGYAAAALLFNLAGMVLLYVLQRLQGSLPLNPQGFGPVTPDLAFNTAVSFVTNTNWQNYGGETTLSQFSQMAGLTVQNFRSATTGMALAIAVTRALARSKFSTLGNFWVDMTRATLYVLLPLAIIVALAFVAMGLPQTLAGSVTATTLEGTNQVISLGPVASQEAINQLGTNGGGFFNVNAAHPFENPTAWSNYLNIFAMLSTPESSTRAVDRFFRLGNLTALRELALRRTADRVDHQMVYYLKQNAIDGPWATGERLIVCVGSDPLLEKVVRVASRLASGGNAPAAAGHDPPVRAARPSPAGRWGRPNPPQCRASSARAGRFSTA